MKQIQIALTVLILLFIFSCKTETTKSTTQKVLVENANSSNIVKLSAEQVNIAGIKSGKVIRKNLAEKLKCNGKIDVPPENIASIHPVMAGFVKSVKVLEGEKVKQGQVLAVLEHPNYINLQEEYLKVKSRLTFSKQEYERQQHLSSKNATALKTFQKIEADYAVLQSEAAGLRAKIKLLGIVPEAVEKGKIAEQVYIRAPFNGTVADIDINIGQYITQQEKAFEVVNKSHIHGELRIFAKDILQVKTGQFVTFQVTGNTNKIFEGEVFLVGETVDEATNTVNVHIHPKDDVAILKLGMYINAEIQIAQAEKEVVPELSVIKEDENAFIFIARGNYTYEKFPVNPEPPIDGYCAISGLQSLPKNSDIVTEGANYLWASL
ncbi:MAG: efflux RND transporter periplasmic adaptor subunit [Bacteroidota bacterium]